MGCCFRAPPAGPAPSAPSGPVEALRGRPSDRSRLSGGGVLSLEFLDPRPTTRDAFHVMCRFQSQHGCHATWRDIHFTPCGNSARAEGWSSSNPEGWSTSNWNTLPGIRIGVRRFGDLASRLLPGLGGAREEPGPGFRLSPAWNLYGISLSGGKPERSQTNPSHFVETRGTGAAGGGTPR